MGRVRPSLVEFGQKLARISPDITEVVQNSPNLGRISAPELVFGNFDNLGELDYLRHHLRAATPSNIQPVPHIFVEELQAPSKESRECLA